VREIERSGDAERQRIPEGEQRVDAPGIDETDERLGQDVLLVNGDRPLGDDALRLAFQMPCRTRCRDAVK